MVGPYFGDVEDVVGKGLGLVGREDLDFQGPGWIVAVLDGVEEVLGVVVWVGGGHGYRFGVGHAADSLVRQEV